MQILHQIPHRVRVRLSNLSENVDEFDFQSQISQIAFVKSARVNAKAGCVVVEFERNLEQILKAISKLKPKIKTEFHSSFEAKRNIALAALSLALSKISANQTFNLAHSFSTAIPLLKDGANELFTQGLTSKALEATAVAVALGIKDFIAANSTNLMLTIGEYIEESTIHKSDDLIRELAKPTVKDVWVEKQIAGKTELVKTAQKDVKFGDIVVAGSGETIGIDGYIVEGVASINQASMTGEAKSVKKERGDRVMSGTIVESGLIKIWAELIGNDTSTERIKLYIQNSLNEKSSIGLKATRLADGLVPLTLGLSVLAYFINRTMTSVASVLQADYSCALKLPTPVAFKSSIAKAGRNGILIKGAKSIEALAKADTFVFDKTGTLTYGELKVAEIVSFNKKWKNDDILNLAASAEEHYFHPIAEAVVNAARQIGFRHIHHDEVEFIVAHGIKTHFNGKEVLIGSRHFLEDDEKINFKPYEKRIETSLNQGYTLLYIAYSGALLGFIAMNDNLRENARICIEELRNLGAKEIVMLTGDIQSKADAIAHEIGIDRVFANLLPTDKAQIIESLKNEGARVVFIGDGINDAPSLVKSDVGISMQKGADITKATADIALLRDDIRCVVVSKLIANETLRLIDRNFAATVWINSAILLGAVCGKLSPTATAFLHNGTTIALLLNSIKGIKLNEKC